VVVSLYRQIATKVFLFKDTVSIETMVLSKEGVVSKSRCS
jgi:hypothetical protein